MTDIAGAEDFADTGEQAEAEAEPVAEPPQELIDLEQFGNRYVPITVDGQEQTVPLSELRQGYQRQADYTQKTQAIAAERERLSQAERIAQALETDPEKTLRILQEAYASNKTTEPAEPEFVDPLERQVNELSQWRQQQEAMTQQGVIERQLEAIHEQHGVDPQELVTFAMENQIPNLEWALWGFQQSKQQAQQEFQQKSADAEAARMEAKRGAAVVHGGAGPAAGSTVAPSKGHGSIADAFAAAKSQLGVG